MWLEFSTPEMDLEKTQQFGLVLKEQKIQSGGKRARRDWQSDFLE